MESASSLLGPKVVMCSVSTRTTTAPCCIALTLVGRRWERIAEDAVRSCGAGQSMTNTSITDQAEPDSLRCGLGLENAHGRLLRLPRQPAGVAQRLARPRL